MMVGYLSSVSQPVDTGTSTVLNKREMWGWYSSSALPAKRECGGLPVRKFGEIALWQTFMFQFLLLCNLFPICDTTREVRPLAKACSPPCWSIRRIVRCSTDVAVLLNVTDQLSIWSGLSRSSLPSNGWRLFARRRET